MIRAARTAFLSGGWKYPPSPLTAREEAVAATEGHFAGWWEIPGGWIAPLGDRPSAWRCGPGRPQLLGGEVAYAATAAFAVALASHWGHLWVQAAMSDRGLWKPGDILAIGPTAVLESAIVEAREIAGPGGISVLAAFNGRGQYEHVTTTGRVAVAANVHEWWVEIRRPGGVRCLRAAGQWDGLMEITGGPAPAHERHAAALVEVLSVAGLIDYPDTWDGAVLRAAVSITPD